MNMTNAEYGRYVDRLAPKSKCLKDCLNAFWVGGLICVIGQLLMNWYGSMGLEKELSATATSISLVFLSAILTGFAVYDDIAKFAGAGTLVPITGFANSIVSPAVEFKTDERDIIYPSQTSLHHSRGEYDFVQNHQGKETRVYSQIDAQVKTATEGAG